MKFSKIVGGWDIISIQHYPAPLAGSGEGENCRDEEMNGREQVS